MCQCQQTQSGLFLLGKTRHVGIGEYIGGMFVVAAVCHADTYAMQTGDPAQDMQRRFARVTAKELLRQHVRQFGHARRLAIVDVVTAHEFLYRHIAHVIVVEAPPQVVQHTFAQRAERGLHRGDFQSHGMRRT